MRNRTIPLITLLVVAIIAWVTHRPVSTNPNPPSSTSSPNENRYRNDRDTTRQNNRADRDYPQSSPEEDRANRYDRSDRDDRNDGDDRSNRNEDRRSRRRSRPTSAAPGTFDFYLLNLSWSPEFCTTHPSARECSAHTGFILHGLWPQNTDGTYPEHCSDTPAPANLSTFSDITPDPGLLQHEWSTHGTCSGLSPDAFFSLARRAFHTVTIPRDLATLTAETSSTPDQILADFSRANPGIPSSSLALSCGNNRLTAIEVCLGKTLNPIACQGLRSCRANSIRITPP